MKLSNLFENTIDVSDTTYNEFMEIIIDVKNQFVFIEHDILYLISDLPQISREQFTQLLKASFEPYSSAALIGDTENVRQLNPKWLLFNDPGGEIRGRVYANKHNAGKGFKQVTTLTWKEFVAKMKTYYGHPSYDDDFSE